MPPPDHLSSDYEVAVILPSYNCEAFLAEAIESVLAQTYRSFRLFVIDDGSTDNTAEVMRRYADRCVCLRQPNGGCASARNHGIRASSSKYVAFLDSDDLWHPTKLERQMNIFSQHPDAGMVSSDFSVIGFDRTIDSWFAQSWTPPDGRIFSFILDRGLGANLSCMIIRREVFDDVGTFNESLVVRSDMDFWLRLAARWKIVTVPEVLSTLRQRRGSLSATNGRTVVSMHMGLRMYQHVEASCPNLQPHERLALDRKLAIFHYHSGSVALSNEDRDQARWHFEQSLRYKGPLHRRAHIKRAASFLPNAVFKFLATTYRAISGR